MIKTFCKNLVMITLGTGVSCSAFFVTLGIIGTVIEYNEEHSK